MELVVLSAHLIVTALHVIGIIVIHCGCNLWGSLICTTSKSDERIYKGVGMSVSPRTG